MYGHQGEEGTVIVPMLAFTFFGEDVLCNCRVESTLYYGVLLRGCHVATLKTCLVCVFVVAFRQNVHGKKLVLEEIHVREKERFVSAGWERSMCVCEHCEGCIRTTSWYLSPTINLSFPSPLV